MTTPQSGREAFEAWARERGYELDRVPETGYYWANDTQDCWEVWQAALAQQDFPARFFASGPQGSAWFDDLSLATAMLAAFDKDDDWTITDTQDVPQHGRAWGEQLPPFARTHEGQKVYSLAYARGRKKGREDTAARIEAAHAREVEALRHYAKAASDLIAADTAYDIAKQAKWDANGIKQQQAAEKAFQSAKSRRSLALSRVLAANNNTRAALPGKTEVEP